MELTIAILILFCLFYQLGYYVYLFKAGHPIPSWLASHFWETTFHNFRWYRKWYGGRWEQWYMDVVFSETWFHFSPDRLSDSRPSSLARGTPIVEEYEVRRVR